MSNGIQFTEMAALSRVSLAMMSLMQALAKDDSPDMSATRSALLKRLEEVAMKDWLAVMRETWVVTAHLPSASSCFVLPPCQSPKSPKRFPR